MNSECWFCSLWNMFIVVTSFSILTSEGPGAIADYHGDYSKHDAGRKVIKGPPYCA